MNAIQQYLTKVAQASIRQATGDLVRDGEVDPHLAVDSMNELLEVIASAVERCETQVPSSIVLKCQKGRSWLGSTRRRQSFT